MKAVGQHNFFRLGRSTIDSGTTPLPGSRDFMTLRQDASKIPTHPDKNNFVKKPGILYTNKHYYRKSKKYANRAETYYKQNYSILFFKTMATRQTVNDLLM